MNPDSHTFTENILWTTNAGPPKSAQALDPKWSEKLSASGDRIVDDALNLTLSAANIKLVEPDKEEFASAIPEAHRKSETAYHVKAFRGSKEGTIAPFPSRYSASQNNIHPSRLSLLPPHRHILRFQKAPPFLPLRSHPLHSLYLRPPTHIQPRYCSLPPISYHKSRRRSRRNHRRI